MIVFQGAKLSLEPIIVNLWSFLGTFHPLTSINILQITWNFQRKRKRDSRTYSFRQIVKKNFIIDEYLSLWQSFNEQFLKKFEKNAKFFWHFLPPKVWKPGLRDLKISEILLLQEFYITSKNLRMMRIARFSHLWHSSKIFSQFSRQIYLLNMMS